MHLILNNTLKDIVGTDLIISATEDNMAIKVVPLLNGTEWILSVEALNADAYPNLGIDASTLEQREIISSEVTTSINIEDFL